MPTLREIAYGSAAISADLIDRAGALGVDFHQGYGMTETGGNVTFLGPADHRAGAAGAADLLRSAGFPHSGVEVAIDGTGTTGEVLIRGPRVMAGYWPDVVAPADGWLHRGHRAARPDGSAVDRRSARTSSSPAGERQLTRGRTSCPRTRRRRGRRGGRARRVLG